MGRGQKQLCVAASSGATNVIVEETRQVTGGLSSFGIALECQRVIYVMRRSDASSLHWVLCIIFMGLNKYYGGKKQESKRKDQTLLNYCRPLPTNFQV
jgi:hypothetical protein